MARLMGEFEYGIFVFVWVLVVLCGNLSCLGFHTAIVRFLPQYQRRAAPVAEIRGLTGTARVSRCSRYDRSHRPACSACISSATRIELLSGADLPRPSGHADDRARRCPGRHVAAPIIGPSWRSARSILSGRSSSSSSCSAAIFSRRTAHGGHRHGSGPGGHLSSPRSANMPPTLYRLRKHLRCRPPQGRFRGMAGCCLPDLPDRGRRASC